MSIIFLVIGSFGTFAAFDQLNFSQMCKRMPLAPGEDSFVNEYLSKPFTDDLMKFCVQSRAKKWPVSARDAQKPLERLIVNPRADNSCNFDIEDEDAMEDEVQIELDLQTQKLIFHKIYPADSEFKAENFLEALVVKEKEKFEELVTKGKFTIEFKAANEMTKYLKRHLLSADSAKPFIGSETEILKAMPNIVQTQNAILTLNKSLKGCDFVIDMGSIKFGTENIFKEFLVTIEVKKESKDISDAETDIPSDSESSAGEILSPTSQGSESDVLERKR